MLGYDAWVFLPYGVLAFKVPGNQVADWCWCASWMGADCSSPLSPKIGVLKGIEQEPMFGSHPQGQPGSP